MIARVLAAACLAVLLGIGESTGATENNGAGTDASAVANPETDPWEAAAHRATDAVEAERKRGDPTPV